MQISEHAFGSAPARSRQEKVFHISDFLPYATNRHSTSHIATTAKVAIIAAKGNTLASTKLTRVLRGSPVEAIGSGRLEHTIIVEAVTESRQENLLSLIIHLSSLSFDFLPYATNREGIRLLRSAVCEATSSGEVQSAAMSAIYPRR